jgi:hypothetical protein
MPRLARQEFFQSCRSGVLEEIHEGVELFAGLGTDAYAAFVAFLQSCLEERELAEGAGNAVHQAS